MSATFCLVLCGIIELNYVNGRKLRGRGGGGGGGKQNRCRIYIPASTNGNEACSWWHLDDSRQGLLCLSQQPVLLYNAAAEIGGGFLVIASLLAPPRSFILVFIYFQFLRMRFWSPDASTYHRMVLPFSNNLHENLRCVSGVGGWGV
jgi:hypothetical protein